MPRSRRPLVPYIRNLIPSPGNGGQFEIIWEGITNTLPAALVASLANYFKSADENTVPVASWFHGLSPDQQEQVSQISATTQK